MLNKIKIKDKILPFNKSIRVSGDKSISIRCVLLASQAIGKSRIYNLLESEDVINSLRVIKKLGINYIKKKNFYEINGYGLDGFLIRKNLTLFAGNSGTLARLILGLLVNSKNKVKITGDKSLSNRDFSRVTNPLSEFGASFSNNNDKLPVIIQGTNFLRPTKYFEKLGSAQCKSSIMLAALKTDGKTIIKAKKSRNHTEIFFKNLNIPINIKEKSNYDHIEIYGKSNFSGFYYDVPGDISSSAFFLVLTLLTKNSQLTIKKVNINKTRIGIIKILNKMNANILFKNKMKYKGELVSDIIVKSKSNLKGIRCSKNINSSAIDEFLLIFLAAAKAQGISTFKDLGELNKKESPRLDIAVQFLKNIGVKVKRNNNDIKIYGNPKLDVKGKHVMKNFKKDHRIFMMTCVAALTLGGEFEIYDKDSINTSFPNFINLLKKLGAKLN